jgi:rubrerythrin
MRLIDADAMRRDWLENGQNEYVYDTNAVLDSIDDQPTIDPESLRPQGEWITKSWWQRKTKYTVNVCSICKSNVKPKLKPNYCPHCGAKMKGTQP